MPGADAVPIAATPRWQVEIIVVDEGCCRENRRTLQEALSAQQTGVVNPLSFSVSAEVLAARNRGVSAACGEIIAFLDAADQPAQIQLRHQRGD